MHIGSRVYKVLDGVVVEGNVVTIGVGELSFVTKDGRVIKAVKGEAHKSHHTHYLFAESLFPEFRQGGGFSVGKLVASRSTGNVVQVVNVDISGAFTLSDGTITNSIEGDYYVLGSNPDEKMHEDDDDDVDEDSDDDVDEDSDDDEE